MPNGRILLAALLTVCLTLGPTVSVWAQSAGEPCESMGMAPADDCCGGGMDEAKCLSACPASSPVMAVPAVQTIAPDTAATVIDTAVFRHASILAPPDITPPRSSVS
jgi:hypothetical protein